MEKTTSGTPDWELEKQKIEQEKTDKGYGKDSYYQFEQGENKIGIDKTKKAVPFKSNFGKERIKLFLTNGSCIAISPILYDQLLDVIIKAKGDVAPVNIIRMGTTQSDTRYSIKK